MLNLLNMFSGVAAYICVKMLFKTPPDFKETCMIVVMSAIFLWLITGVLLSGTPDYISNVIGIFLGYVVLLIYTRLRS